MILSSLIRLGIRNIKELFSYTAVDPSDDVTEDSEKNLGEKEKDNNPKDKIISSLKKKMSPPTWTFNIIKDESSSILIVNKGGKSPLQFQYSKEKSEKTSD